MTPKVLTRAERQEQTREQLLDAAAQVFARRGYHEASVEEIASEAGFSTGAVYSNFDGKEELFLALADREVEKQVAEIRAVAEDVEAGGEAAAEAGRRFQELLKRDRDWPLLFYEFWSFGVRSARIQGEFAKRRQAVQEALAETLDRLAAALDFELRFPAPMLATAIGATLNGLAFERAADPGSLTDEVVGEFVAAILGCSIAVGEH
ncbi:MAG TPA: TetR/AcrR family transcriptional regulator [Solirubrobacterales bacterium]|nr:TetR/AcrR family transcriptional regulator [Solirubrobacterales bacterium]